MAFSQQTPSQKQLGAFQHIHLAGVDKIVQAIVSNVSPIVSRRTAALRFLIATPAPGSVVLHGSRACGKTTLLNAICSAYRQHIDCLCHVEIISCRSLRGLKMNSLKEKLSTAFDSAIRHAPSILAIDDLDAIVPAESDAPGAPNAQSQVIAEHIHKLMTKLKQHSERRQKHLWRALQSHPNSDDSIVSLSVEQASVREAVAVVVSAADARSFHELLAQCGYIDRPVAIPPPDITAREKILTCLHKQQSLDDAGLQFRSIAAKTEGYGAKDLESLVLRTRHLWSMKQVKARHSCNETEALEGIGESDYLEALENYVPSSLRGAKLFKSDVKWTDVGGLEKVRQTLRETLELPTKYARLYDAAPIKLPAGVLLYGPPGCGKTLLAGAVANECGLNFISVKGYVKQPIFHAVS